MSGLNYEDFKKNNDDVSLSGEVSNNSLQGVKDVTNSGSDTMFREPVVDESDGREFNLVQVSVSSNLSLQHKDVQTIMKKVDIGNTDSILLFGQDAADGISRFSDKILAETAKSTVQESGKMLKDLAGIMKQFDPKDFSEEPKKRGLVSKLFNKASNSIEGMLSKYQTMDKEIQNLFIQIKEYESEIKKSNLSMNQLYDKNVEYYEELEKYIYAGSELRNTAVTEWIPRLKEKSDSTKDARDIQEYNEALDFVDLMDQRVADLEMARMVSVQTAPQIKMIQKGNHNLMRKINSAFVVTLPTFKTGLVQAINIKKQKMQAEDFAALDEQTNAMLIRNAENIKDNGVLITRMAGSTSIHIETLETTFDTIMRGIEEIREVEVENRKEQEQNRARLLELQEKIKSKNF